MNERALTVEVLFKLFKGKRSVVDLEAGEVADGFRIGIIQPLDQHLLVGSACSNLQSLQLQKLLEYPPLHLISEKASIM